MDLFYSSLSYFQFNYVTQHFTHVCMYVCMYVLYTYLVLILCLQQGLFYDLDLVTCSHFL